MKRLISLGMTMVLLLATLSGCNKGNTLSGNNGDDADSSNTSGKIYEASFVRNEDGTCTDKESGVVFLDDDYNDFSRVIEKGAGLSLDDSNPTLFNRDTSRAFRYTPGLPGEYWMIYKFDAGITEVAMEACIYDKADYNATIRLSVSKDKETWETINVIKDEGKDLGWDTWMLYTFTATSIDPSNVYLKLDFGDAPELCCWNVNLCRIRINNIKKMNDPDRLLENRASETYYVDSKSGSDNNDGKSQKKAFKSLSKLSSKYFQPGDKILFKKGLTYSGSLVIRGFGTEDNVITVGSYGSGDDNPIINGRGATAAITMLANYITVKDLDITNASGNFGVYINCLQTGENPGITVTDCNIYDVDKNESKFTYIGGGGIVAYASGTAPTWFKDLTISNNNIKNVCRCAIDVTSAWGWRYSTDDTEGYIKNKYVSDTEGWYPSFGTKIVGNTIDSAKGDSVLVQCGKDTLIERNSVYNSCCSTKGHAQVSMVAIWTCSTVDTVMQYNEVAYTNRPSGDGEAFDTDHSEVNCKIQYNYSHDNKGGFVLLCNGFSGTAKNAIVRYNLSVNDGKDGAAIQMIGDVPGTKIYNNTFWLDKAAGVVSMWGGTNRNIKAKDVVISNNIFAASTTRGGYPCSGSVGEDFYAAVENLHFNNNLYSNVTMPESRGGVSLKGNVTGDPKFTVGTDFDDKAKAIKAFTPKNKISGAVGISDNGGIDINGDKIASNFFGCVAY